MTTPTRYTFGDNDMALARLDMLAAAYEPTSMAFLRELMWLLPRVDAGVLDLGCGPGHTSVLLATMLRPRRLDALDSSPRYVNVASERLTGGASRHRCPTRVHLADAGATPYPVAGVDCIYARHLLAHLADPSQTLAVAARSLAPRGIIAVEETAGLDSDDDHFRRYYQCVQALQRHYGQRTFVGRELADVAERAGLHVVHFVVRDLELPARTMAALHSANIRTWGHDPAVRGFMDAGELHDVRTYMDAVACGEVRTSPVSAPIGQIIMRAS